MTDRRFEDLAVEAFHVLRKNSSLLVTLFSLMVSCGIPELQVSAVPLFSEPHPSPQREEDIAYLRDNLMSLEVSVAW
jgi:hypothetical protein